MKRIKVFNISASILAAAAVWSTNTVLQTKIVSTVFFCLIICFWLIAKGERKGDNFKILG
jgi:hypothetical protein